MWNTPQVKYKILRLFKKKQHIKAIISACSSLRGCVLQVPQGLFPPSRCLAAVINRQTLLTNEEYRSYSALRLAGLDFTLLDSFPETVNVKWEGTLSVGSLSSPEPCQAQGIPAVSLRVKSRVTQQDMVRAKPSAIIPASLRLSTLAVEWGGAPLIIDWCLCCFRWVGLGNTAE